MWLQEEGITQHWCRPLHPKAKPFTERFIGTFQSECLDYHYEPMHAKEMQEIVMHGFSNIKIGDRMKGLVC